MRNLRSTTALSSGTLSMIALGISVSMAQSIDAPINYDEAPINGQFENTEDYTYQNQTTEFVGSGDFNFSNSGNINQIGNIDDFLFAPVITISAADLDEDGNVIGGNLTLSNTGIITTVGQGSEVINAFAVAGSITLNNQGYLTTLGSYSPGVELETGLSINCIDYDENDNTPCIPVAFNDGGNIEGVNAGRITTFGHDSYGIEATSYGADINIQNLDGADIETHGWNAHGIYAKSGHVEVGPHQAVNLGGAISLTNNGDIFINGGNAHGIYGLSAGNIVTLENNEQIFTSGPNSSGLRGRSGNDHIPADGGDDVIVAGSTVTGINTGLITTEGHQSHGIDLASAGGNVVAINTGEINTEGYFASGIKVESGSAGEVYNDGQEAVVAGGDINVLNDESGHIQTSGPEGDAIDAWSNGGDVTITNHGTVLATGDLADGIVGLSGQYKYDGQQAASIGGTVTINSTGTVETQGHNGNAIGAFSNGGAVMVTNSGSVTAGGDFSHGIGAFSGTANTSDGGRVIQRGTEVSVINSGEVSTFGNDSSAIYGASYGGAVNIANTGNVSTEGFNASALHAYSGEYRSASSYVPDTGGDITINTGVGTLSTQGDNSNGISANTLAANISIDAGGIIQTAGNGSHGIVARSGNVDIMNGSVFFEGGTIIIANSAIISTQGEDSSGIQAWSATDSVAINNTATITTDGLMSGSSRSAAIHAGSGQIAGENYQEAIGSDIAIINSGSLAATSSHGIYAGSNGGHIAIDNSGAIATQGQYASILAETGQSETADIFITNSGDIATESTAIKAYSELGGVAINNVGDIDVDGRQAIRGAGNDLVTITNSGDITASRDMDNEDFMPMIAGRSSGDVVVSNSGTIVTTGYGMRGIGGEGLWENEGGDGTFRATNVLLDNSGSISTDGDNAHGLVAKSNEMSIVKNSGTVTVTDEGAWGISVFANGGSIIDNSGTINATNYAIITGNGADFGAPEEALGATDLVNNSGTINGNIWLGALNDTLINTGLLNGEISFGDGDDTFIQNGGDILGATFIGGDDAGDTGIDSVIFEGGGTINGAQYAGFENLHLFGGTYSGADLNAFTQQLNVGSNAILNLENASTHNLDISGRVNTVAGATVSVDGDLNATGASVVNIDFIGNNNASEINVMGDANFDSAGNLFVSSQNDVAIAVDDGAEVISASNIVIQGVDEGESFTISDSIAGFNFEGLIASGTESAQSIFITAVNAFGDLVNDVTDNLASEASALFDTLDTVGSADAEFSDEQEATLREIQLLVSDFATDNPDDISSLVGDLSSAASNESAGVATTSIVQAASGLIQNRIQTRIESAFTAPNTNTANSFAPETQTSKKINHIMAYVDGEIEASAKPQGTTGEVWAQFYGSEQNVRNSTFRMDQTSWGLNGGVDFFVSNQTLLGASLTYSQGSGVSTIGTGTTQSDNKTAGINLYAGHTLSNGVGLSGSAGYFWTTTDQTRNSLGSVYSSNYDSNAVFVSGTLSKLFTDGSIKFVPQTSLTYTHITNDGYTEVGTGVGAQSVSKASFDSLVGGVGFSLQKDLTKNDMVFTPEVHANALYEFNDTLGNYSVALADGAINFSNKPIVANSRLRMNLGGSLTIRTNGAFSTQLGYDAILGKDENQHTGRVRMGVKF